MLIDKIIKSLSNGNCDISKIILKNPTCTEPGEQECTCSNCHSTYKEIIPALGHDYINTITKEPSCETSGVRTYNCTKCHHSYTETIPTLGHNYTLTSSENASCTTQGYKTYTCSRCGKTYTETIAKKHTFINNICTNCGLEIGISSKLNEWIYTLNDIDKIVTLHSYTGSSTNVRVYSSYNINNQIYRTAIGNNPSANDTNGYMFSNNKTINSIIFDKGIDMSKTTNINNMFANCGNLISIQMSSLDTSNIINMVSLFIGCTKLKNIDIETLNTGNVKYMMTLFFGCNAIETLDLSNWDTKNLESMPSAFCMPNVLSIDLRNWDTHKTKDMRGLFFSERLSVVYVTLGKWSTTLAKNTLYGKETGDNGMFAGCNISSVTYA